MRDDQARADVKSTAYRTVVKKRTLEHERQVPGEFGKGVEKGEHHQVRPGMSIRDTESYVPPIKKSLPSDFGLVPKNRNDKVLFLTDSILKNICSSPGLNRVAWINGWAVRMKRGGVVKDLKRMLLDRPWPEKAEFIVLHGGSNDLATAAAESDSQATDRLRDVINDIQEIVDAAHERGVRIGVVIPPPGIG